MSIVARCGSVALVVGLLVGVTTAARSAPESSGTWTDPPVRGAVGPVTKPGEAKPSGPAAQPPAVRPTRTAARPTIVERPIVATRRPARPSRTVVAHQLPAAIRPLTERPRIVAAPAAVKPLRSARLRTPVQPRRRFADRSPGWGERVDAEAMPLVYPTEPPRDARRAGWSGLVDDRADRIARAQAAGYRVMRLRTYAFPDGGQIQQLSPFDPDDLN